MASWHMLTVVGRDRPKIVARLARALYRGGYNLGEASMIRLGGCFTIMVMAQIPGGTADDLAAIVRPEVDAMDLHMSITGIEGQLHRHKLPDVCLTVSGADRAGIVARIAEALADAGLDVLDLRSDVAGSAERPLYVMQIEGLALDGFQALERALETLDLDDVEVRLSRVETLVG